MNLGCHLNLGCHMGPLKHGLSYSGAGVWNTLPFDLQLQKAESLTDFCHQLNSNYPFSLTYIILDTRHSCEAVFLF